MGAIKKNPKIFVVEDDYFFLELIKAELQENDFTNVRTFSSGAKFLEHLSESPDVVIMDHQLGEYNGLDLLKSIKKVKPKTQVIFLSGQEDIQIAINSLEGGAYEFLEKGDGALKRMTDMINQLLESKRISPASSICSILGKIHL